MTNCKPTAKLRPRRSVLFMPATNARAVQKSRTLDVDTVILDMEDSVHRDRKSEVRLQVQHILNEGGFNYREVLVRINALDTEYWQDDIKALSGLAFDGLVVPKVDTLEQLEMLQAMLQEQAAELAATCSASENELPPVWIMLESAKAILASESLCAFGTPVVGMLIGTADLSRELRIPHTADRFALQASLSRCVLAARAAGIVALDGVFMDIKNADGLRAEALQGMQLGFDGKTLIHPAQLAITNEVFAPTDDENTANLHLIAAWRAASERGEGVCVHEGRLVESLHVEQALERVAFYESVNNRN